MSSSRNILLALVAILVVGCLCTAALALAGGGVALLAPNLPSPALTALPSAPAQIAPTRRPTPTPTATNPGSPAAPPPSATPAAAIPAGIAQQMDEIERQVIALRRLEPSGPVQRQLINRDQLEKKVVDEFFKDYSPQDAKNDEAVLTAFGLLPPGFDLLGFYQKMYTEGIAGFYENHDKAMYVVTGQGFQGEERLTYSHEYTHVLQDQNFDIENGLGYSEAACKEESERCAGVQALIEGDATLVEQDWLLSDSTPLDKAQLQQSVNKLKTPIYDSAPAYLQQDFIFPYRAGQEFVQSLYDRGGWAAVDQAYRNPPTSTEQILHPDRYPDDKPVEVSLPDLSTALGPGWQLANRSPLGEWYTYLVLAEGADQRMRVSTATAQTAAEGWGGDEYAVYNHGAAIEAVLTTQWDTAQDAAQFRSAFAKYGKARWGTPIADQANDLRWQTASGVVELLVDGLRTTWVTSPDVSTHQAVLAALQMK